MEGLFQGTKVLSKVNKSYQIKCSTLPGPCATCVHVYSLFNTCTNLLASQKGHHGVVLSLLRAGADVNIATSVSDVMLTS